MKPITHHFFQAAHRPSNAVALRYKQNGRWVDVSWQEYYLRSEQIATALMHLGVEKGDRIGICANTRWEWAALDFAIMGLGAITVPIYQSSLPSEIEYIAKQCELKVLFLENQSLLKKWNQVSANCPSVKKVVLMDGDWDAFFATGDPANAEHFRTSLCEVRLEDTATIVFTSGTSGTPKGVVLTHLQIASEMYGAVHAFRLLESDVSLCFLPYSHVLGRIELWLNTFVGFTMVFAESIERIKNNLREVQPTLLIGVPRIFEKIHAAIIAQTEGQPWRKAIFEITTQPLSGVKGLFLSIPQKMLAEKLIYSKVRQAMGGRIRFVVSGGAPLAPEIAQFFYKAGVLILEGYGLTETTGAVFANTPDAFRFGTVGRPMNGTEIKIAEDGEILIKSSMVMKEYYKDPESTASVLVNGFFATGDIGELSDDGFLRITDRKKDLIKTSGGKYVAPQKLENLLKINPLISQVLVHGDQKKYIVVLVTLDAQEVKRRKEAGKGSESELQDEVRAMIKTANANLASFETIKNFSILPNDFTVENGELTPSLKLKRKFVDQKYHSAIEALY